MKQILYTSIRLAFLLVALAIGASTAIGAPGDLFESDLNSGTINKFAPDGTRSIFATGLNWPNGLAFDSAGNLYEGDQASGSINKFAPDGTRSTFATGLNNPAGLACDRRGNLFEADWLSGTIYKFAPDGARSTFATGVGPYGLAFDSAGNLFSSNGNNTIENGGKARVRGSEVTATYKVLRGLTVGGNMSYSDAKLAADVPALDAKNGQRLPLSPRVSGALTTDYSFPLSEWWQGTAGFSYRFIGNRPVGFDGSTKNPQYWLRSYDVVDLHLGLQTPLVNVSLFCKNVFNKLGEISADASALANDPNAPVRVAITQPRTIGLMFTLGLNSE